MENRAEWLKWRHAGIGSSDAPVIMGKSPYKTRLKLYEEKILTEPPEEARSFILDKGNRLEPIARGKFAALYGLDTGNEDPFGPRLFHLEELPFLKASLDGCSKDGTAFIEIKYVGQEEFENLKEVPERYVDQIQHQFMVSGCKVCYFVLINDKEEVRWLAIAPDEERQAQILAEETVFWFDHVLVKKPPDTMPGDYVELRFRGAASIAQKYKQLKAKQAEIEAEIEKLRDEILNKAKEKNHARLTMRGLKIFQSERAGSVDYKKIPELQGVNLDQYRKAGSKIWTIR